MNYNHEIWIICSSCGLEFDIRLTKYCPECKCENKI
jgi:predicted Zn-ribbon and HTH transcriptional regulator